MERTLLGFTTYRNRDSAVTMAMLTVGAGLGSYAVFGLAYAILWGKPNPWWHYAGMLGVMLAIMVAIVAALRVLIAHLWAVFRGSADAVFVDSLGIEFGIPLFGLRKVIRWTDVEGISHVSERGFLQLKVHCGPRDTSEVYLDLTHSPLKERGVDATMQLCQQCFSSTDVG